MYQVIRRKSAKSQCCRHKTGGHWGKGFSSKNDGYTYMPTQLHTVWAGYEGPYSDSASWLHIRCMYVCMYICMYVCMYDYSLIMGWEPASSSVRYVTNVWLLQ